MTFDRVPSLQACGAVLAHSIGAGTVTFKKGHRLSAADCDVLAAAGISSVLAARLGPGDVGEDEAAAQVAARLAGAGVEAAAAFTGRANLHATRAGLLVLDRAALDAVNGVDEAITVATLVPFSVVEAGDMIATVKIIPFGVAHQSAEIASTRAGAAGLEVRPFRPARAGLVLTRLPHTKASVIEKRRQTTAARLEARGASLSQSLTVAHDAATVAAAIRTLAAADCDPILIFAASAIVDRADVVPAGLVEAGGSIERLGMPVDPGNLIMLGGLGGRTVIGVPSCAASPKLNGFDWVLERVLAGLAVSSADVARMGVGGLLGEIAIRPQPRARPAAPARTQVSRRPRIAALVLAAGRSTRMGGGEHGARMKLLEPIGGTAMVRHVVEAARASQADGVVVVTGHRSAEVRVALAGLGVGIVENPRYGEGLATSLSAGLRAIGSQPGEPDGVIVLLGDMPRITRHVIDRLIQAFAPADGRSIVVPTHAGRRGNPVLWARAFWPELTALTGDTGGRGLIERYRTVVAEVDVETPAIHLDIDTPEALEALRQRIRTDTPDASDEREATTASDLDQPSDQHATNTEDR